VAKPSVPFVSVTSSPVFRRCRRPSPVLQPCHLRYCFAAPPALTRAGVLGWFRGRLNRNLGGRVDALVGDDVEVALSCVGVSHRHSVQSGWSGYAFGPTRRSLAHRRDGWAGLHDLQPDPHRRVSQAAISLIETGRLDARCSTIRQLSSALEVRGTKPEHLQSFDHSDGHSQLILEPHD